MNELQNKQYNEWLSERLYLPACYSPAELLRLIQTEPVGLSGDELWLSVFVFNVNNGVAQCQENYLKSANVIF